jgi:hypothetical protein
MSEAERYGNFYWCIKTDLSPAGDIYIFADKVEINENGDLIFICKEKNHYQNMSFAKGEWKCFFAASVMDGHAVAVEHWEGEVIR